MTARASNATGALNAWIHVALWFATMLLALAVGMTALAALLEMARGTPPPSDRNLFYLIVSALLLLVLIAVWRRYWFTTSHLVKLLRARGAIVVERQRLRECRVKARVHDLWVIACLDRAALSYWPHRQFKVRDVVAAGKRGVAPTGTGGFDPAYMGSLSRVHLIRLGDFSRVGEVTLPVTKQSLLTSATGPTGDPVLNQALRDAAPALTEPDMTVLLEVRSRWLRVQVTGGTWLGPVFGRRISDAIDFAGRLLEGLSSRFTPHDPQRSVVDVEGDTVRVSPFVPSGRTSLPLLRWIVMASVLFVPWAAEADPPQQLAAGFLVASQDADGGWSSRYVRRVQATAEALRALQVLNVAPAGRTAAAVLLESSETEDTDDRARRIEALFLEHRDVSLALSLMFADRDPTGGWALDPGFSADPVDTALALIALAASAPSATQVPAAVSALVAAQHGDGGWGCTDGTPSERACTAQAVIALAAYRDKFFIEPVLPSAAAFLRAGLNPDGSIGSAGRDLIYTTALAARALTAIGDEFAGRLTVISFLQSRQSSDGSWDADPLLTAVALRALDALLRVPVCGDSVINRAGEACDGADLAGKSCEALGLGAGTLSCSNACTFNTSACAAPPSCGDGVRNQPDEACDGTDLGAASCQSVGFLGGTLGCTAECNFDAAACEGVPACGDGKVNRTVEQCDGSEFAGASCSSLGLLSGALQCASDCTLRTSGCTGTGQTDPRSITIDPSSPVCQDGSETRPVSITFPDQSVIDKVDVFMLFDDTGSFAGRVPAVAGIFNALVTELQTALPGISFGFGIGRFEDYGGPATGFSGEVTTGRPFTLNQPIITPDVPSFSSLISGALNRTAPGFGGDGPETNIEALFQIASGSGFDGNGNGSKLDSGPTGAAATQSTPGLSGDIPAFTSNVAPASGTLGGVGFRPRALHLVIQAGDICSVAPYQAGIPVPPTITGAGGATLPSSALRCSNPIGSNRFGFVSNSVSTTGNTVANAIAPLGAATVPATIAALNALGISVIGLADGGTSIRNPVGPSTAPSVFMSAVALLTGAIDASGNPLVFNISGGTTPLKNAIVQAIRTVATRPVDVGIRAVGVPADVTASLSPAIVPGVSPGGTASFALTMKGSNVPRGSFSLEFFDSASNAVLGSIPVTLACLPVIDPPVDADEDGFPADRDCDDLNPAVNPGMTEVPGNGLDDDCNPATPDVVTVEQLACTVTTDKVTYGAHDDIRVDVVLRRTAGDEYLSGLNLNLDVRHASDIPIGFATDALAPLGPGERRQRTFTFSSGGVPPGEIAATVRVTVGADVIASCMATATISSSIEQGVALIGSIAADPPIAFFRDPVVLRYSVENKGNVSLDPANLEILVVNPATGDEAARFLDSTVLATAATFKAARAVVPALPVGDYLVVLRGGPGNDVGTLASASLKILEPPNNPPLCIAAAPSVSELWPPNHKFSLVGIQGVTDPDGDAVAIRIMGVTQDESVLEQGSGNTCPDAIVQGDAAQLRAERTGRDSGRVYRLRFEATDPAGAQCTGEVNVCVTHDQSHACVDSGQTYDATVCAPNSAPKPK